MKGTKQSGPADSADQIDSLYDEALHAAGALDFLRALSLFDRVIALDPGHAEAYYKRGNALKNAGQLLAAVASYDQAIAQKPNFAYALCNRGVVQQALGLNSEALASYDLAIVYDPADTRTYYNRALVLQEMSDWVGAVVSYEQAISIDPGFADAQYNRSLALLYCEDLKQGLRAYEWRWQNAGRLGMGRLRNFEQPLWLGDQPLQGKRLLLHSEGGLGDTLQFCRYASLAADHGATVYLEIQAPLQKLLSKLEGTADIIVEGNRLPPFDYHCPMMSLPLAFETRLDNIPPPATPLWIDVTRHARWASIRAKNDTPRIGLVWSGNPQNANDLRRSVRLADLIPRLPREYQYYQLQKDVRDEDRVALAANSFINSIDEDVRDFPRTAALCRCMDLVISVDTSVAHLSASLGRPTWLLLPFIPDWRWFRGRNDSPWYPTMRLIRQTVSGNWTDVFERVANDLRREYPID